MDIQLKKLENLGPFSVTPTTLKINLQISEGIYTIDLNNELSFLADNDNVFNFGSISLPFEITLDDESKRKAGIPTNAKKFYWCYPLAGITSVGYIDKSKPNIAFICYGGFVYTDHNDNFLTGNAIGIGNDLKFGNPIDINFDNSVKFLRTNGYLQDVTAENLIELTNKTVRHYTWIPPKYMLNHTQSEHGGFLYEYLNGYFQFFPVVLHDAQSINQVVSSVSFQQNRDQLRQLISQSNNSNDDVAKLKKKIEELTLLASTVTKSVTCCVCLANDVNVKINGCDHACLCVECYNGIFNSNPLCPVCRNRITGFTKVYFA
jgi:hypothetical protein